MMIYDMVVPFNSQTEHPSSAIDRRRWPRSLHCVKIFDNFCFETNVVSSIPTISFPPPDPFVVILQ